VLDDVWQSIDDIYRNAILQYVFSRRFRKWQLLILVHDRLWARLIDRTARKHGFPLKVLELVDWTPEDGPRLRPGTLDTTAQLAKIIGNESREMICSFTGRVLEELAGDLSVSLGTSVTRKPWDSYELEDLWAGVYKVLAKSDLDSKVKEAAEGVNSYYALRNIYGAHYSIWAQSLSETEAIGFARFVVNLSTLIRCDTCGTTASRLPKGAVKNFGWLCGHVMNTLPAADLGSEHFSS
jgi:hypothetical protein